MTTVDIFGTVGVGNCSAVAVGAALSAIPKTANLTVRINSYGGHVWDAFAIYELIAARRVRVTIEVVGVAASCASMLLSAGRRVTAAADALFMLHDVEFVGPAWDGLPDIQRRIIKRWRGIYGRRWVRSGDQLDELLCSESYFDASTAKAWGLIDEITPPSGLIDPTKLPPRVRTFHEEQRVILHRALL